MTTLVYKECQLNIKSILFLGFSVLNFGQIEIQTLQRYFVENNSNQYNDLIHNLE